MTLLVVGAFVHDITGCWGQLCMTLLVVGAFVHDITDCWSSCA